MINFHHVWTLTDYTYPDSSFHVLARNLDETTRSVYKENVRVSEALNYHMVEGDKLKETKERLEEQNQELQGEQELNALVIQDKVAQARQQKHLIKEVRVFSCTLCAILNVIQSNKSYLKQSWKTLNTFVTLFWFWFFEWNETICENDFHLS